MLQTGPELDQILDDLEALPWTRDLEARTALLISERLGCTNAEAINLILRLQARKAIEPVSKSGDGMATDHTLNSLGWKWKVTR